MRLGWRADGGGGSEGGGGGDRAAGVGRGWKRVREGGRGHEGRLAGGCGGVVVAVKGGEGGCGGTRAAAALVRPRPRATVRTGS